MKKLRKEKLLILDEWLLYPLKEAEPQDSLELAEARDKVASTIFCSQYDTSEWHENLYDPTLADAICDRIIYKAYTIQIEGESMERVFPCNSRHGDPLQHACDRHAPSTVVILHFLSGVCTWERSMTGTSAKGLPSGLFSGLETPSAARRNRSHFSGTIDLPTARYSIRPLHACSIPTDGVAAWFSVNLPPSP